MAVRRLFAIALSVGAFVFLAIAPAQAEKSYVIEHYDVRVELQEDGSYEVRETLDFDFRGETFSFAYREISLRGIDRLEGLQVASDDVEILDVEEDERRSRHSLRWEFPPRLGSTRFEVSYRAVGALIATEGRNRIDWDAVGRNWDIPIEEVTVTVVLPDDLGLGGDQVAFQPPDEATLHATAVEGSATGWEVRYRYQDLAPETAYRVIVDFPQRLAGREPPGSSVRRRFLVGGFLALLVGFLPSWVLSGRRHGTRVAPGDGTHPEVPLHEAAVLLAPRSPYAERGFVAAVFDLARRGHVELVRRKRGSGWFQPTQTYLEKTSAGGEGVLSEFEEDLLDRLRQRESLEEFGRKDRAYRRRGVEAIRRQLIDRGWLIDRSGPATQSLLLGSAGLLMGVLAVAFLGGASGWILGGLMIGLSLGWLIATVRFLPPSEEGARKRAAIVARVEHLQDKVADHLELGDEARAAESWLDYLPWLTLKPKPSLVAKLTRRLKKSDARLRLPGWARDESGARVGSSAAAFIAFQPYLAASQSTAGAVAPSSGASASGGAGAGAGGGAGGGGGGAG